MAQCPFSFMFFAPSFFRAIGRLPLWAVHRIGALAGAMVHLASPTYRKRVYANLSLALGNEKAQSLRWPVAFETGKQAFEFIWVLKRSRENVLSHVRQVTGDQWVLKAKAEGAGILYLTPHLGCFEIAAQYLADRFGPLTVLFREPRKAVLAPLMAEGRNRPPMQAVPADLSGVRQLMKALRAGNAIGMLPDQAPAKGEGVWADFFGRPAWTMTLASRLAEQPKTCVILVWVERLSDAQGYAVHLSPGPVLLGDSVKSKAETLNQAIEQLILQKPDQYLWGYNRYKCPPGVLPPDVSPTQEPPPC
jgi:Kdo2-lipid IVA lauroyltransferase/acyltransferase